MKEIINIYDCPMYETEAEDFDEETYEVAVDRVGIFEVISTFDYSVSDWETMAALIESINDSIDTFEFVLIDVPQIEDYLVGKRVKSNV